MWVDKISITGLILIRNICHAHRKQSFSDVLKNFANFPGKHLRWSLFWIKVAGLTLLKRDTGVFVWKVRKFWEHIFLQNTSGGCYWLMNKGIVLIIFSRQNAQFISYSQNNVSSVPSVFFVSFSKLVVIISPCTADLAVTYTCSIVIHNGSTNFMLHKVVHEVNVLIYYPWTAWCKNGTRTPGAGTPPPPPQSLKAGPS